MEIDKEKSSVDVDDFPIEIDDFFNDCYRFCSSIIIDKLFSVTSISIDFRYQSIFIGGLNRLISMMSIDFR